MNITDFRTIAETLGRFADVRETAKEPRDRIVIQTFDGRLKFVAGAEYGSFARATVVVDGGTHPGHGMAVVASRPLLSAAKMLRGKGTVEFTVTPDGAVMKTSTGGEVALANISSTVPDLLRSATPTHSVGVPAKWWPGVAKVLSSCSAFAHGGWEQVGFKVTPYGTTLLAGDAFSRAEVPLPLAEAPFHGAIHPDFISALRDFEEAGTIGWNGNLFVVQSGPFLAVTNFMAGWPEVPESPPFDTDVEVTLPRAQLAEMVKSVSRSDSAFGRVILVVEGDRLTVTSWDGSEALGSPARVSGSGKAGVVSERLAKVITAIGGKDVTLRWLATESGPVMVTGDGWPWGVLVARVALA